MTTKIERRRARRFGGIVIAILASCVGLMPVDVEVVAWLFLTGIAVLFSGVQLLDAWATYKRAKSAPLTGPIAEAAAFVGATLETAESHVARESYRLLANLALFGIGVAALIGWGTWIAPLLFLVVGLILLNSLLDRMERAELRKAFAAETGGRRSTD